MKNKKRIIIIASLIVLFVAAFWVSKYYYQLMLIQGDSMSPTYKNFSLVVIDKRADNYKVGDVIAFRKDNIDGVIVKRIAGCPGDTEYSLGEGEYYVLGDNLDKSIDSRSEEIGNVLEGDIIGRICWPVK